MRARGCRAKGAAAAAASGPAEPPIRPPFPGCVRAPGGGQRGPVRPGTAPPSAVQICSRNRHTARQRLHACSGISARPLSRACARRSLRAAGSGPAQRQGSAGGAAPNGAAVRSAALEGGAPRRTRWGSRRSGQKTCFLLVTDGAAVGSVVSITIRMHSPPCARTHAALGPVRVGAAAHCGAQRAQPFFIRLADGLRAG